MAVLFVLLGISIPIVAILSSHQYKMQKLRMEKGQESLDSKRIQYLEQHVQALDEENKELRNRLNNVETIVSDPDFLLGLPKKDEDKEMQQLLQVLAERKRKN